MKVRDSDDVVFLRPNLAKACNVFGYYVGSSIGVCILKSLVGCKKYLKVIIKL